MGVDLSLKAIPKFGKQLIEKAESRKGTEYASLLFHTFSAFKKDFCDFGNPDWMEFKKDARALIPYFKEESDLEKYSLDTNRTYEAIDYLMVQLQASKQGEPLAFRNYQPFYYSGFECAFCKGGQGYALKYWDLEMIKKKNKMLQQISFPALFEGYQENEMIRQGVYKIEQIKKSPVEEIKFIVEQTKVFLKNAEELGGYVLVCKD